jgi:transposase
MANGQVNVPLDISNVVVLEVDIQGEAIHIKVESALPYARCHQCGRKITMLHGYGEWVKVQHLPSFGRTVFIHYRPKRYRCPYCEDHPTTRQQLSWHEPNSPHTKAYDRYLLRALVNSTVQDVAIKESLPYDTVWGVIERCIASQVDWARYTRLDTLGLDEFANHKGHRDFIGVVSTRLKDEALSVLSVLPDRKKETVQAFLESIPAALRATIRTVCCDMHEGFVQAVRAVLPKVRIVIDRFHVAKLYHEAADKLRKCELARLKKSLLPQQYRSLKGSLWAFRKNPSDLEPEEQAVLSRLFGYSPTLKMAYDLREALTDIFDQAPAKNEAKRQLRAWQADVRTSGLACFDSFLATLDRYWNEIANYFVDFQSSGFVEGLNNKFKVLKRRCYGLYNLDHIFQRIFLDLEGYRLFA